MCAAETYKMEDKDREPIAIIGMAGRYPQDSKDNDRFWKNLLRGRSMFSAFPKERFNQEAHYHPDHEREGTFNVKGCHFLSENSAEFDAPFFKATKTEVMAMDPQHRLVMENIYHALEDAGLPMNKLAGSNTSVFVGAFASDFLSSLEADQEASIKSKALGTSNSIMSNRVSWFFDFKGPSLTLDTACSSSMVALHLACQSLRNKESDMAIVSGVSVVNYPTNMFAMSNMGFLGPDGLSYSFDHRANGYSRGEGVATVVIKPLSASLRDGDMIRAVVRATGANQDGRTPGITLPSQAAQEALIRQVYEKAGLDVRDTPFVEAHGTGTASGDPIEAASIASAFKSKDRDTPLYIGALKSSVGHLEGASGVAGLIKTVMILESGILPPNINFEKVNPKIPMQKWNIQFPLKAMPFPAAGRRRASVNSFGFGGTNGHAVLDDAYHYLREKGLTGFHRTRPTAPKIEGIEEYLAEYETDMGVSSNGMNTVMESINKEVINVDVESTMNGEVNSKAFHERSADGDLAPEKVNINGHHINGNMLNGVGMVAPQSARLFVWSSFDEQGVGRLKKAYMEFLQSRKLPSGKAEDEWLHSLAYTLACKRTPFPWKSFCLASSAAELVQKLSSDYGISKPVRSMTTPNMAFAFTGQGAQWHAMGRELSVYPVFQKSMTEADAYMRSLGSPWSLTDELQKDRANSLIDHPKISHPACAALQIALIDLLLSWSIRPTRVLGHSSGEIAAAYCAGYIDRQAAWKIAYYRGLVSAQQAEMPVKGAMMAVGLSESDIHPIFEDVNRELEGELTIACYNSAKNLTISGAENKIDALKTRLDGVGVFARKLKVQNAYHSAHMRLVAANYLHLLGNVFSNESLLPKTSETILMFSSVTGHLINRDDVATVDYWVRNLVSPVRFHQALIQMVSTSIGSSQRRLHVGNDVGSIPICDIIEIGPHTALQSAIKDTLATEPKFDSVGYHGVLSRNNIGVETILKTVGTLFCRGVCVDINSVNVLDASRLVRMLTNLPPYPFNHSKLYWSESRLSKNFRCRKYPRHDLLGAPVADWDPKEPRWRHFVKVSENPWLNDHRVTGRIVYPGVGFLIMAIEAAKQTSNPSMKPLGFRLRDISIKTALVVPDSREGIETMLTMRQMPESSITPSSIWNEFRVISCNPDGLSWTEHCSGIISVEYDGCTGIVDNGREAVAEAAAFEDDLSFAMEACQRQMDIKATYDELAVVGLQFGPLFKNLSQVKLGDGSGQATASVTVPDVKSCMPKGYMHSHIIHPSTMDGILHLALAAIIDHTKGIMLREPWLPVFIREVWLSAYIDNQVGHSFRCHGKARQIAHKKYETDITVWDGIKNKGRVTLKGLQSVPLQSTTSSAGEARKLGYHIDWKPDVDLLDSSVWLARGIKPNESDAILAELNDLQIVSVLLIANALNDFKGQPSQPHLQKYLAWMEIESTNLANGKLMHQNPKHWQPYLENRELGQKLIDKVGSTPGGQLLVHMGNQIAPMLRDEIDPLQFIFKDNLLEQFYHHHFGDGTVASLLRNYLDAFGHNNINLRVLEIGAGTGGTTLPILETLNRPGHAQKITNYTFTDISPGFFEKARIKFKKWLPVLDFKVLDIEKEPSSQGIDLGAYDIVVAGNVLHATADLTKALTHVRSLLRPGGKLILDEYIQRGFLQPRLIFGLLPGWWRGIEPNRQWSPILNEPEWDEMLRTNGFTGNDLLLKDNEDYNANVHSIIVSTAASIDKAALGILEAMIVVSSLEETSPKVISSLQQAIAQRCSLPECKVVEYRNLSGYDLRDTACISLLGLGEFNLSTITEEDYERVRQLLTTCGGLIWVTDDTTFNPSLAMATGLIRTLRWEREYDDPNLVTLMFEHPRPALETIARSVARIYHHQFMNPVKRKNAEYLFHDGILFTNRLVEEYAFNEYFTSQTCIQQAEPREFGRDDGSWKLSISTPGMLNKLEFVDDTTWLEPLADDEVEVEIKASGLNFRDIMVAMGEVTNTMFGYEGAGIVSRIGSGVNHVNVGDRVLVLNISHGTIQSYTRASAPLVHKIPDSMSFEVAAGIPLIFSTGIYCLYEIARLTKGETILIHAAAGGMGQASIMLAKLVGAEVFATVSSQEKKALLMETYGIPENHIFSSRDFSFAKGIMRVTKGRGVDVIINSLAGEALRLSWHCIAPFGRFIEIGRKDIYANGRLEMLPFSRSVSYSSVDFWVVIERNPSKASWLIQESLRLFAEGKIQSPRPYTVLRYSDIEPAFRLLQSGKGMGKIILKSDKKDIVPIVPRARTLYAFDKNATYVLAGGLGGIGRSFARWMASHGAKHFVFLSRSGASSNAAKDFVIELEAQGIWAAVFKCDISDKARLQAVIEEVKSSMPPIKGCIQGSMQLKDVSFERMSYEDFQAAIRPKVQGSWNLHELLPKDMTFFILLSSVCSIVGNRGQGNYAAGNAYQDALAQYRVSQGLPATSLNLGVIRSVGYVAERRVENSFSGLQSFLLGGIGEDELHSVLAYHVDPHNCETGGSSEALSTAQLVTGLVTSGTYKLNGVPEPGYMRTPLFTQLRAINTKDSTVSETAGGESIQALLRSVNKLDVATTLISEAIQKKISHIMLISADEVDPRQSISSYGVDSLVAMELRSWFGNEMGADVKILDLVGTSSILELSGKIAQLSTFIELEHVKKPPERE